MYTLTRNKRAILSSKAEKEHKKFLLKEFFSFKIKNLHKKMAHLKLFTFLATLGITIYFIALIVIKFLFQEKIDPKMDEIAIEFGLYITANILIYFMIYYINFNKLSDSIVSKYINNFVLIFTIILTTLCFLFKIKKNSSIFPANGKYSQFFGTMYMYFLFIPLSSFSDSTFFKFFLFFGNNLILLILIIIDDYQNIANVFIQFFYFASIWIIIFSYSYITDLISKDNWKNFQNTVKNEGTWKRLIEEIPLGIAIVSHKKGELLFCNNYLAELLNFDKSEEKNLEIINKKIGNLFNSKTFFNKNKNKNDYLLIQALDSFKIRNNYENNRKILKKKFFFCEIYSEKFNSNDESPQLMAKNEKKFIEISITNNYKFQNQNSFLITFNQIHDQNIIKKFFHEEESNSLILKKFSYKFRENLTDAVKILENLFKSSKEISIINALKYLYSIHYNLNAMIDFSSLISNQFQLNNVNFKLFNIIEETLDFVDLFAKEKVFLIFF